MRLYIDTRSRESIIISLSKGSETFFTKRSEKKEMTPELALEFIKKALDEASVNLNEITKIEVEKGSGSYTGIRVGVSVANSLSFALGIPINEHKISSIVIPEY